MIWICNIVFALIVVVWFIRFFAEMGYEGKSRVFAFVQCQKQYIGKKCNLTEVVKMLALAFSIRVVFYIIGIALVFLFHVRNVWQGQPLTFQNFLSSWNLWDAGHYMGIADIGYSGYVETPDWSGQEEHLRLVFFPMYPWLMRVMHLFIKSWELCGMAVSNLAFCIGSVFFYGVLKEEFGKNIAERAYWLLVLYPFSFFFGGIMTESLFFCLMAAGFYYIRKHKWPVVAFIGIAAALCRVQGILLLGVGMVEFLVSSKPITLWKEKKIAEFVKLLFTKAVWLFLIPVGNVIYFLINYKVEGDPFRFKVYQEKHWYHTTVWFAKGFQEVCEYAFRGEAMDNMKLCVWYPEFILFLLAVVLIIYSLRTQPLKYSAYLIVYTMVNYSVTFLLSGGRYMLNALPIFLFLATWTEKHTNLYRMICLIFALLSGIYFAGFICGLSVC